MTTRREKFEIKIEATPEQVWEMLTTKEGLQSWFGTEAEVNLEIGGSRTVGWGEEMSMTGELTGIEPNAKLVVSFKSDAGDFGAEEWLIDSEGTTTRLTLLHSMPDDGIDDWDGFYGDIRRGWRLFMESMKFALESADTPYRTTDYRYLPAEDRESTRHSVERILAESPELVDGMRVLVDDPPHSLMYVSSDRSLLIDLEGNPPQMVLYLQASTHGGSDRWREDAIRILGKATE